MKRNIHKIVLGTAKLGIENYGFSSNEIPLDKAKFLSDAYNSGISSFDTSPRYGSAERHIGELVSKFGVTPTVSSKIDNLKVNDPSSPKKMIQSVKQSLKSMMIEKLDICYLHQNDLSIISDPYIQEGLLKLKDLGLIDKCGTSIYYFEELDYTTDSSIYDCIQIPLNILDTSYYERIIRSGSDINICARSIFLQGILFEQESINQIIKDNNQLLESLKELEKLLEPYNVSFRIACLAFVYSLKNLHQVIIGSGSIDNLNANIQNANYDLGENLTKMISDLAMPPKPWTNPKHWKN